MRQHGDVLILGSCVADVDHDLLRSFDIHGERIVVRDGQTTRGQNVYSVLCRDFYRVTWYDLHHY